MTRDEAWHAAYRYLRCKLLNGATADALGRRSHEGYGAPGEPGYLIGGGRITVPGLPYKGEQHRFPIADLAARIHADAPAEFARARRAHAGIPAREPAPPDRQLALF